MVLSNFKLNGVTIKTPQGLTITTVVERQRVVLLSGKPKERIKRVYRLAKLSFSFLEDSELQKIIAQTLTKVLELGTSTVDIEFLGLSGKMERMTAIFSDISASVVAESILNNRWAELDDLIFEEV